jgi:hypothetical protein
MGYRGTSNCLLNFGEGVEHRPGGRAGALGYLVGQPGQGLAQMFHMMNEARIGVGLSGAALGYRGYRLALDYARERVQGRAAGSPPTDPPQPIIDHPDVRRMLLAQKAYAEGALALVLYAAALVDEADTANDEVARDEATRLLALLTPIAKTWPSEWGLAANDLAIQIHGGYGYTRDFDVEQLYRDNRLNAIHEGTTGIQALDLLGRKILRDEGRSLSLLAARMSRTTDAIKGCEELSDFGEQLLAAVAQIQATASDLSSSGEGALWNATPFLRAFGHSCMAWLWLDQARAVVDRAPGDPFREGKLRACRYFYEFELPLTTVWLDVVRQRTDVAAGMPVNAF